MARVRLKDVPSVEEVLRVGRAAPVPCPDCGRELDVDERALTGTTERGPMRRVRIAFCGWCDFVHEF